MAFDRDLEKAEDLDNCTTATESTACHSDSEKVESKLVAKGAYGEPDTDH